MLLRHPSRVFVFTIGAAWIGLQGEALVLFPGVSGSRIMVDWPKGNKGRVCILRIILGMEHL